MTLEEAVADAYCPCHGEPWYVFRVERRCRIKKRKADARYHATEKGRAAHRRSARTYARTEKGRLKKAEIQRRYAASEKGRAAKAQYRASDRGQEVVAKGNARRVFGASGYVGRAPSPEQAEELNQMRRDRKAARKERDASTR